jgi:DNA-binding NarL/FixJ family response regulator
VKSLPAEFRVRRLLVLREDRFSAHAILAIARDVFPTAWSAAVQRISEAREIMRQETVDLWLTGVTALDGDVLDFLAANLPGPCGLYQRALVVTVRQELRILLALRRLPLGGVFDLRGEEPAQLREAIKSLTEGRAYWSPDPLQRLREHFLERAPFSRLLTPLEQLVLAVAGSGMDDETAAVQLGISAASIHSVRRQLHHKLGLSHRGHLIQLAAEMGFVRFTSRGVIYPGLSMLRDAWRPRAKKRRSDPNGSAPPPLEPPGGTR